MITTRTQYRLAHSDIRAIARHCTNETDKRAKLKDICERRRFWFGDRYAAPASPGAQAALRVMMARYTGSDPIVLLATANAALRDCPQPVPIQQRKLVHRVVLSSLRVSRHA